MIGIFGGTFNPVHKGHLSLAEQALTKLNLQRVEFLPCNLPVHRDSPAVTSTKRAQMIKLAITGLKSFHLNSLEIDRGGFSFTVDTLSQLRQQFSNQTICLLLGTDSFNGFMSWKKTDQILQKCNIVVCQRPGNNINKKIYPDRQTTELSELYQNSHGKIFMLNMDTNLCSSSKIRSQLAAGETKPQCLSTAVLDFIFQHNLYGIARET